VAFRVPARSVTLEHLSLLKRWNRAADQGDAYAQSNLGRMYAKGYGVPEDDAKAGKTVVAPNNTCNANATLKSFIPRRMLVPRLGKYRSIISDDAIEQYVRLRPWALQQIGNRPLAIEGIASDRRS
jgi:hypothetical protein